MGYRFLFIENVREMLREIVIQEANIFKKVFCLSLIQMEECVPGNNLNSS